MGKKSVRPSINPLVLRWARERAHYEPEEVGDRLNVSLERYQDWESGAQKPTLIQLRGISDILRRSISTFYLNEPPDEPEPLKELRRLPEAASEPESAELALQVHEIVGRRQLALNLYRALDEEPPRPGISVALSSDPETAGQKIRANLGVDISQQSEWRGQYVALREWRAVLERSGVLVFHMPKISLSEMRGLTLSRTPLPVIGINSRDAPHGRIFTLLHEFCHVLLKDSVLHSTGRHLYEVGSGSRREEFCNAVASAVLVPKEDLSSQVRSLGKGPAAEWADREVDSLVRRYQVSKAMMVRRLYTLGFIEPRCYEALRDGYDRYRWSGSKWGNPYATRVSHFGTLLPSLAFRAYYTEKITTSELSSIFRIKVKYLGKLEFTISGFNYGFGS